MRQRRIADSYRFGGKRLLLHGRVKLDRVQQDIQGEVARDRSRVGDFADARVKKGPRRSRREEPERRLLVRVRGRERRREGAGARTPFGAQGEEVFGGSARRSKRRAVPARTQGSDQEGERPAPEALGKLRSVLQRNEVAAGDGLASGQRLSPVFQRLVLRMRAGRRRREHWRP
jgi:hypothetical protein